MDLSRRRKLAISALVLYWPAFFILAHIPIPQAVRRAGVSDKNLHFMAYLILVFLLASAINPGKKLSWRNAGTWLILFVALLYGVLDELSQGFIGGRTSDIRDFMADLAGAATGLVLLSIVSFWPAALLITAGTIFGVVNCTKANLSDVLPVTSIMINIFGYALFTLLWAGYVSIHSASRVLDRPIGKRPPKKAPGCKWLITVLSVPAALLVLVKLGSVVFHRELAGGDIVAALIGIVAMTATAYFTGLIRQRFAQNQRGVGR